jgi:hypothetical protein
VVCTCHGRLRILKLRRVIVTPRATRRALKSPGRVQVPRRSRRPELALQRGSHCSPRETALIRKFSSVITTPVHPGGSDPVLRNACGRRPNPVQLRARRAEATLGERRPHPVGRCGWRSAHLAARATRQLMPAVLLGPYLAVLLGMYPGSERGVDRCLTVRQDKQLRRQRSGQPRSACEYAMAKNE